MKPTGHASFSSAIEAALTIVESATKNLAGLSPDNARGAEKDDESVGHHAIVTRADTATQKHILEYLSRVVPHALFITEEKTDKLRSNIVTDERLTSALSHSIIFGVDPIDGTSMFNKQLYEFSVSVGVLDCARGRNGHLGGAISLPAIRRGIIVAGERGRGTWTKEGDIWTKTRIQLRTIKDSVVYTGVDLFFLEQFSKFTLEFSRQVRTTNSTGSCALGLALLAAGRVDAVIQPVQCPWDWFAGYPLVEEAGGKLQFYYYGDGKNQRAGKGVVPLEKPDLLSYSSEKRNTAFIAGNPEIVDWLFELLQETWQPQ